MTVKENVGFVLRMSESQVRKQLHNEGFLGALAGLLSKTTLSLASRFIPKIFAPLATGALTTVGDVAIKKIMGKGMINVPNDKKIDLLKTNVLTKIQKKKLVNAYNNKKAVNIKFKFNQLTGYFPIMITKRQ